MTTDIERLEERFGDIRREWSLQPGELETRAQNEALAPLRNWLQSGAKNPEVIIRAVQVLLVSTEQPGIHKRPVVKNVLKQLSKVWASAGYKEQDVLLLQGMIIATWPQGVLGDGARLALLLDSAWTGVSSVGRTSDVMTKWRQQLHEKPQPTEVTGQSKPAVDVQSPALPSLTDLPDFSQLLTSMENSNDDYTSNLAKNSVRLFRAQNEFLQNVSAHVQNLEEKTGRRNLLLELKALVKQKEVEAKLDLLWWGQSKYSTSLHAPYRKLTEPTECLWWMAWDCSALSYYLDVEPCAAFFVDVLHQLNKSVDTEKRKLKEWMLDLVIFFGKVREGKMASCLTLNAKLDAVVREDALGLPVSWARTEVFSPRVDTNLLAEKIHKQVAVDPETEISLGEWASWVFREMLLDRYLGAV